MASSLAVFAAARGIGAGQQIGEAYKQHIFASLQSDALQAQMREIDERATLDIEQTFREGERVVSEQTSAFVKGGVDISGSAMEVLSDTLSDAAEAAFVRRRESDFELMGLGMREAALDSLSSDMNLFLNVASAGTTAYAGFLTDEFMVNKVSLRNRGAGGIE